MFFLHFLVKFFGDVIQIEFCSQNIFQNDTSNSVILNQVNDLFLSFGIDNELVDNPPGSRLFKQLEIFHKLLVRLIYNFLHSYHVILLDVLETSFFKLLEPSEIGNPENLLLFEDGCIFDQVQSSKPLDNCHFFNTTKTLTVV
jgi:hypothetical protein